MWWLFLLLPLAVGGLALKPLWERGWLFRLWKPKLLYWCVIVGICGFLAIRLKAWGRIPIVFVLWRATFWWNGSRRAIHGGALIPTGHTILVEDQPHWAGFFPLMFKWWVGPGSKPKVESPDKAAAKPVDRLSGLLGQAVWLIQVVLPSTWIEWYLLGWWRVRYIVTQMPDGKKGKAILSLPERQALHVKTKSFSTDAGRLGSTTTRDHFLGGTTIDPTVIIGEEKIVWPYTQRTRELLAAVGS